MTEVKEKLVAQKLALENTHRQLNASMIEHDGWTVPASYGEIDREYAVIRETGAGLIDLSPRGRLLVSGSEAVQFLNGLITNDVKTLAENSWMPAAFPNVQGRLLAVVRVAHLPVDGKSIFLIDTEAATHSRVRETLERFTLAGDFQVKDITAETALLSLQGTAAADILGRVVDNEAIAHEHKSARQINWYTNDVSAAITAIRASHTGSDGMDLIIENRHASALWRALTNAGAQPVGYDALEILRIEGGIPRFGKDIDETTIVTEANLDDAVSYTKGCYIGQEIIARIKYRGHIAKKLSGMLFDKAASVAVGTAVKSADEKEIGRLTSVTHSQLLDKTIALGYIKYDYLKPGTQVTVVAGAQQFSGEVAELPFLKSN